MTHSNTVGTVAKRRARQAGLTLAETLLVLAIGALAIVGGTLLYLQATAGNKLNTGINQFVTLQSGIRSLYAGQSDFSGLTTLLLTQANAAPSDMVISPTATTLRNAWGGPVRVTAPTVDTFAINFDLVPNNACVRLITLNPGGTGGSGLKSVKVGANVLTPPLETSVAVAKCNNANDRNTIVWTFN